MNPRDMKTVIMLDRTAKFAAMTNETVDFTIREGPKQKKLQIDKTIWTWCLEGVFEIHRILSDVYPSGNLQLRFALADFMGKMLDTEWTGSFLSREELVKLIGTIIRPTAEGADVTPIGGLTMAIEALAVETPEQKEFNYDAKYNMDKRTVQNSEVTRFGNELLEEETFSQVENKGNLIVYTRLKTEEEMEELKKNVIALVTSRNKIASSPSNKTFCPITSLQLFILNFYPSGETCTVKTHPLEEHPDLPLLKIWVISRKAFDMPDAVHSLLMAAFDLSSTTVTKIPMKEDNRGSSNYDVELFHSSTVHKFLKQAKLIDIVSKNGNNDNGVTYDTMRLAWTTAPKKKWSLFPHHGDSVPCTTVQAYSRPSACLTQFVRDGRCVMLDLERTSVLGMNMPNKLVSHLLIANRGRIFIQEVDFVQQRERHVGLLKLPKRLRLPKQPLNISQLKHTYRQMELKVTAKNRMKHELTEKEKQKWNDLANADIEKRFLCISRNIPMYAKDMFIFNDAVKKELEPLITTITKLTLSDKDVENCKSTVLKLLQLRNQSDFIVPEKTNIGPCSVKELADAAEQMRVTLVELAKYLVNYVKYSEKHEQVYKTFMTTMSVEKLIDIDVNDGGAADKNLVTFPFFGRLESQETDNGETDNKRRSRLARYLKMRRAETNEVEKKTVEEEERKYKKKPTNVPIEMPKEVNIDLFANICEKIERKESRTRREFVGREMHGNKAPLYPQLAERTDRPASPVASERTERVRNADRGGSGTPPLQRRQYN